MKRSQEHYYNELKENTRVDSQLKEAQARIASIDADYRAAQNQKANGFDTGALNKDLVVTGEGGGVF